MRCVGVKVSLPEPFFMDPHLNVVISISVQALCDHENGQRLAAAMFSPSQNLTCSGRASRQVTQLNSAEQLWQLLEDVHPLYAALQRLSLSKLLQMKLSSSSVVALVLITFVLHVLGPNSLVFLEQRRFVPRGESAGLLGGGRRALCSASDSCSAVYVSRKERVMDVFDV